MRQYELGQLRRRLKKLGRRHPAARVPAPVTPGAPRPLPDGDLVLTTEGQAYRLEHRFDPEHVHGNRRLVEFLSTQDWLRAQVAQHPGLEALNPSQLVFIDNETTGLAGGAGTLVFLVGVGRFTESGFVLRQYFLRDPAEEPAMLSALEEDLRTAGGFVSFNGRAFDVPLLETRYVLGLRRDLHLGAWPHLDLLFPARRLWRRLLPDCTLGTLEREILEWRRSEEDVPSWQIPALYLDYLRTGDASQMLRVLDHNTVDVLSLVALATTVLHRHAPDRLGELTEGEALAVAGWHQHAGRIPESERAFTEALSGGDAQVRLEALRRYTFQLKRQQRYQEAVEGWQAWHEMAHQDPTPSIELAKYYEWVAGDLELALHWAQVGLESLTYWPPDWRRDEAWDAITHRLARLAGKVSRVR